MAEVLGVLVDALPQLAAGLVLTILVSVVSLVLATVLGLISGLMSISTKPYLSVVAKCYVSVVRGTPLLIQILFIYFGLPAVLHTKFPPLIAGIVAVSLNIGAYISEVFRAGIESIDVGQVEASRSLGLPHGTTMRYVILPQATRRMVPPMINQFIIGIKDTSMLSVIGVAELTQRGQAIYAMNFKVFEILTVVGALYFLVNYLLSVAARWFERRYVV